MKNHFSVILLLLLLNCLTNANAQISDSLYTHLPGYAKPAKQNAVTLQDKAKIIEGMTPEFAERYSKELSEFVPGIEKEMVLSRDKNTKVEFAFSLASFYTALNDFPKGFEYCKKTVAYALDDTAYKKRLADTYSMLASYYVTYNNTDSAMQCLAKALDFGDHKDSTFLSNIYATYSLIYTTLHSFKQALYYDKKTIETLPFTNKMQDEDIRMYIEIGVYYALLFRDSSNNKYADSAKIVIEHLMQRTKDKTQYWYAGCYFSLGLLDEYKGRYKEAVASFDSSLLPKYLNQNLVYGINSVAKVHRSVCLAKLGNKEAVTFLDTLQLGANDFATQQVRYKALYEYAKQHGNWRKSLEYYESYIKYTDSLNVITNRAKVFEANQKYSFAQKEIQIKTLENRNLIQKQAGTRLIIIAGVVLTFMLTVIALLYVRNKKKESERIKEKQKMIDELQLMEQERELSYLQQQAEKEAAIISERKMISQNMHDEISSSLTGLSYLIAHVKRNMSREGAVPVELLGEVEEEARSVYRQARDFMNALNHNVFSESYNIVELLHKLEQRFNQQHGLKISVDMDEEEISTYFKSNHHAEMYRVVKEAVTNSIKHSAASAITINLWKQEQRFYFDIADNGHGIKQIQNSSGMGMTTMKQRIATLNGDIHVVSDHSGTHVTGSFPA